MDKYRFTLLKSPENKGRGLKSERVLRFPRLKVKFGPKTPVSPYCETMHSFYVNKKGFKSLSPVQSFSQNLKPGSPKTGFIDSLVNRYEANKEDHVDIASKFSKVEEIKVFWRALHGNGYIPDARTGATMSVYRRGIYLFAGEKAEDASDIKKFDYGLLVWERVQPKNRNPAEIPVIKSGHTSSVFKNYLVVYGGFSHFDSILQIRHCVSLVYCFDFLTHIWKSFKPTGKIPEARRNHCSVLIGHSLVVYSGVNSKGEVLDSVSVLNLQQMHWGNPKIKGEVPLVRKGCTLSPVFHHSLSESYSFDVYSTPKNHDNIFTKQTSGIYLFGGLSEEGEALNDVYVLKGHYSKVRAGVSELVWSRLVPGGKPPMPRFNHSAVVSNGFLIVMGGRNDRIQGGMVNELAILRVSSWRWEHVAQYGEVPSSRTGSSVANIGNRVLVFGGIHLNEFAPSIIFELETDQKQVNELLGLKRFSKETLSIFV